MLQIMPKEHIISAKWPLAPRCKAQACALQQKVYVMRGRVARRTCCCDKGIDRRIGSRALAVSFSGEVLSCQTGPVEPWAGVYLAPRKPYRNGL